MFKPIIPIQAILLLAAGGLYGQAVAYNNFAFAANPSCVPGARCALLAVPGSTVNVCQGNFAGYVNTFGAVVTWVSGITFGAGWTGSISIAGQLYTISTVNSSTSITLTSPAGTQTGVGYSSLGACIASPATTYTSSGARTACPSTAQLVSVNGGACTSTADGQGNLSFWALPGLYSLYETVPTTAGGGTYGPYLITVSNGCPPGFTCDANYGTILAACADAGHGTLFLSKPWSALDASSFNAACENTSLIAGASARLQPASGQALTISCPIAGPYPLFDYSAGGTVTVSGPCPARPEWWGAIPVAVAAATARYVPSDIGTQLGYAVAGALNLHFGPGVYQAATWPRFRIGQIVTCDSPHSTILRNIGRSHGLQWSQTTNQRANSVVNNCGVLADGVRATDGAYINDVYNVTFNQCLFATHDIFNVAAVTRSSQCAGTAQVVVAATDGANSNNIVFNQSDIFQGSGDGIQVTGSSNIGNGLTLYGGEVHGMDGIGINGTGAGDAHEILVYGSTIEGNRLGEFRCVSCTGSIIDGAHIEHVTASSTPIVIAQGGAWRNSRIRDSAISCGGAPQAILAGGTFIDAASFENNNFAGPCSANRAMTFGSTPVANSRLSGNTISMAGGTAALYDYETAALNFQNVFVMDPTIGTGTITTVVSSSAPAVYPVINGGAVNYIATEGAGSGNNAITGVLPAMRQLIGPASANNSFQDGFCVMQKLTAHTFQAGANTYTLNAATGVPLPVFSSFNPSGNIARGDGVGAMVQLCFSATANSGNGAWLHMGK